MNRPALIIAALLCMASRHPDRMIRSDIVLNASFNRGDATDRSIYAATPTLAGNAVITAGQRYLTLDGTGDFVSYGDRAEHSFTDGSGTDRPFSVSAWVYMDDATSFRLLSKATALTSAEFFFGTNPSDFLALAVYSGGVTGNSHTRLSDAALTAYQGQWAHVTGTYSGGESNASLALYVNGAVVASTGSSSGAYTGISNTTADLAVGAIFRDGTPTYANGDIDDLRIYSRELSAAEVAALYSSGRDP